MTERDATTPTADEASDHPAAGAALPPALDELLDRFRDGERVALARAITLVENERPGFQEFLHAALALGFEAGRIGLTGPPGAGKSSLATALCGAYRERDEEVGVVAVDPTSPFSGGALLGDRIRMNELATDPGVFIRSMATRGSLGGLATTTREVLDLLDAFGFPRVLVETVGVGQTELEITAAADTVVVVLVPESGDAIQAMKAGLMEIADIFVVNKADRPGADRVARELRSTIGLRDGSGGGAASGHHGVDLSRADRRSRARRRGDATAENGPGAAEPSADEEGEEHWEIPVLETVAHEGEGVEELVEAIDAHRAWLVASGELERRRRERARSRIREVVERELRQRAWTAVEETDDIERGLDRIARGEASPYSIAAEIIERLADIG